MQEPSPQNETKSPSAATGQRLREARESLGLSLEDVARELRLHEKLIGALEEGDLSQLPPAAFISGYLRSYARLLDLPSEQMIADYLAERVGPAVYRATDRTGMPVMTSRDPKFRVISMAVIAVSLLLSAAWWANQRFSLVSMEPAVSTAGSGEHHEIEATLPEPAPLYQEPHPEEADNALQPENKTAPAPALTSAEPVAPAANGQKTTVTPAVPAMPAPKGASTQIHPAAAVAPMAPVANGQKATASSPSPASAVTAPQAQPTSKPAQTLPAVPVEPLAPSVPQSTLALEFQAASWTQVEDANGRVLVYKTIDTGRKLTLHGVAPFKVFLGYAPGVVVHYNGTLFPHAAYQRGDLARFSVGSSQDNRPLSR